MCLLLHPDILEISAFNFHVKEIHPRKESPLQIICSYFSSWELHAAKRKESILNLADEEKHRQVICFTWDTWRLHMCYHLFHRWHLYLVKGTWGNLLNSKQLKLLFSSWVDALKNNHNAPSKYDQRPKGQA